MKNRANVMFVAEVKKSCIWIFLYSECTIDLHASINIDIPGFVNKSNC